MKLIELEVRVMGEGDRREVLRFPVPDNAAWIMQDSDGEIWVSARKGWYTRSHWRCIEQSTMAPYSFIPYTDETNYRASKAIAEISASSWCREVKL